MTLTATDRFVRRELGSPSTAMIANSVTIGGGWITSGLLDLRNDSFGHPEHRVADCVWHGHEVRVRPTLLLTGPFEGLDYPRVVGFAAHEDADAVGVARA